MPTYAYRCGECGREFERSLSIAEREKGGRPCPGCGSSKVEQVFRPFFARTSRKS